MNKNEFEIKKLGLQADKFGVVINLMQHTITMATVLIVIYFIVNGLEQMVTAKPDSLSALALVVEKLKIDSIMAYLVTAATTVGWAYERSGKKRAIKKLDALRGSVEREDPYHPSSNLDENGHTPK